MNRVLCKECRGDTEFEICTVGLVLRPCEICESQDNCLLVNASEYTFEEIRLANLRKRFAFEPGSKWKDWITADNWLDSHFEEIFERVSPEKAVKLIRPKTKLTTLEADKLYLYCLQWLGHLAKCKTVYPSAHLQLLMELCFSICDGESAVRFAVLDDVFTMIDRSKK